MTPFELQPGMRVMQSKVTPLLAQPRRREALMALLGRLGTVELVSSIGKCALVRWDDGSEGFWTADCLEAA